MKKAVIAVACFCILNIACSPDRYISRVAKKDLLKNKALASAHIGISFFNPVTHQYWYNYQGDKYFVPASNTKLATCYAAMKYLGKNLPALHYQTTEDSVFVQPTGDPTFLHPDFSNQRAYNFLWNIDKTIVLNLSNWQEARWGNGWAWDDYTDAYMAERSAMPIYGNIVRIAALPELRPDISYFTTSITTDSIPEQTESLPVWRPLSSNTFYIKRDVLKDSISVPFYTQNSKIIYALLADTLHKAVIENNVKRNFKNTAVIHSQPTDSLLAHMMYRSDNLFAEQSLLMVSNELLGSMNDGKVIDTLLKTDLSDLPQKPRWVDGSGLSRYNLFTPQDLVMVLVKLKNDFGMERMKAILPTGNSGTLNNYYTSDSSYIYAKTGSLSGVITLSGYLYTRKNKLLIFSVLVNNHQTSGTMVRKSVEQFLRKVRNRY